MNNELNRAQRVATGISGLDLILKGGLFKGGVYLVMGLPGSGKTILANQICFNHAATGGRALYVTLLAESHARMLASLSGMAFFDERRLANEVHYLSGYQALESEKLEGLTRFLRKAVHDHRATFLVIDGLVTASSLADSEITLKKFVHELQSYSEMVGCTALLLTGSKNDEANYPERTMVDGLFQLTRRRFGMRSERELEVLKFRGSANLTGGHFFDISDAGIRLHPRIETVLGNRPVLPSSSDLKSLGIEALDAMLGGGLLTGSSTLVIGAPGCGKTTLGMQFLAAGATRTEPGLYLGFFESPERLRRKGNQVSIDLASFEKRGLLHLSWRSQLELTADALADYLLEQIQHLKIKRLFIDGLAGFSRAVRYPERTGDFMLALTNELRALQVTTVISDETPQVLGQGLRLPEASVSEIVENLVVLRYLEAAEELHRVISVLKRSEGHGPPALREFSISTKGIAIGVPFGGAARQASRSPKQAHSPTARGGRRAPKR